MKTHLLCFILLFYLINSLTKENCDDFKKTCYSNCEARTLPNQVSCKRFCSNKSYECYKRAEAGLEF